MSQITLGVFSTGAWLDRPEKCDCRRDMTTVKEQKSRSRDAKRKREPEEEHSPGEKVQTIQDTTPKPVSKKRPMVVTLPTAAQCEILERARRGDFSYHTAPKCHCIVTTSEGNLDKLCQKNARKGGDVYCAEHDAAYQHELAKVAQKRAARMREGPTTAHATDPAKASDVVQGTYHDFTDNDSLLEDLINMADEA